MKMNRTDYYRSSKDLYKYYLENVKKYDSNYKNVYTKDYYNTLKNYTHMVDKNENKKDAHLDFVNSDTSETNKQNPIQIKLNSASSSKKETSKKISGGLEPFSALEKMCMISAKVKKRD